jgi:ferredoxin/flavodoxin---NADP+ reductase
MPTTGKTPPTNFNIWNVERPGCNAPGPPLPGAKALPASMIEADKATRESLIWVRYWAPNLLSFRTTRDASYKFAAGQFARLGLVTGDTDADDGTVWRPYSIVSGTRAEYLEFCSVVVPSGQFTRSLVKRDLGSPIYVEKDPYGFLTTDRFTPGESLWMIATGTGLAPFISMLYEPEHWTRFGHLVVVHSVRYARELAYAEEMQSIAAGFAGLPNSARLHYLPIVTREDVPDVLSERVPVLLDQGALEERTGLKLDPAFARVLLCGNPAMVTETRKALSIKGFAASRRGQPGTLAVENYW